MQGMDRDLEKRSHLSKDGNDGDDSSSNSELGDGVWQWFSKGECPMQKLDNSKERKMLDQFIPEEDEVPSIEVFVDLKGNVSVVEDGEERSPLSKNRGIESHQEAERE
ncbi:hypothetical protein Q3G72_012360 [Acer saccharum]|nr:hypothetical protein Q3G72_012360 [Acer saccharum]